MGIAISHGMCGFRMTHTLGTVSPVPTAILNQNPHLKHGGVSKCHFGIQLLFCSLVFPYLENRNSVEFAACGTWGGLARVDHLLKRLLEGLTFLYQS